MRQKIKSIEIVLSSINFFNHFILSQKIDPTVTTVTTVTTTMYLSLEIDTDFTLSLKIYFRAKNALYELDKTVLYITIKLYERKKMACLSVIKQ